MASPRSRAALAAVVAVAFMLLAATLAVGQGQLTAAGDDDHRAAACEAGTAEECVAGGGGTARRELWQSGYISYDAMSRGRVPCSYRGASYYNCRPGGPANPYSRGCSRITHCRG
ncbi:hypothetical protein HU200_064745 [Digitaria exilis]|uniref:Uncharacterized protein n=1 Tax=Digitaria exilis TaxID=1010633 RepID=A0A835A554_9POAL|nr:hypothetical protein HU200_064745 [Digitaria exilis]